MRFALNFTLNLNKEKINMLQRTLNNKTVIFHSSLHVYDFGLKYKLLLFFNLMCAEKKCHTENLDN